MPSADAALAGAAAMNHRKVQASTSEFTNKPVWQSPWWRRFEKFLLVENVRQADDEVL
jgi:hypothetical protein